MAQTKRNGIFRYQPVAALAVVLCGGMAAQSFEAAAIHPHEGALRLTGRSVSGSSVTVHASTLLNLITDAYNIKEYQVAGATGWMTLDRFDIAARAPGDVAPPTDQIRLMLQTLLAERFQLKLRRETREMSIYAVVADKGGHKLKGNSSTGPTMFMGRQGENSQMKFTGTPLDAFAEMITRLPGVDRPAFDKTGLTGRYDFELTLAPFTLRVPPDPAAPAVTGPSGESLFTAIEEQLGLKLESQKAPVEVLVIERVERPSEN
jgi:uncharacterized protein (TIGR03435 family)